MHVAGGPPALARAHRVPRRAGWQGRGGRGHVIGLVTGGAGSRGNSSIEYRGSRRTICASKMSLQPYLYPVACYWEAATSSSIVLAITPVLISTHTLHTDGGFRLCTAFCVVFRLPSRKIWKRARPSFFKFGRPHPAIALQYLTYTLNTSSSP